ncbi:MAG: transglycosylase SLT domain-containing protein [Burkholderiales bacterium]|nr:transglycosylase SLT domain-containing protein [Burkholderiales bacterium]
MLLGGCAQVPVAQPEPVVALASPVPLPEPVAPAASAPATPEAVVTTVPLQPRTRLDPADDAARSDLWARVREGMSMPDIDNDLVHKWEQWYAHDPAYVQRMTERGGRYLFYIVEEVERRGMPSELALLPFVESAFNPHATSHARASGMWQFMPQTGRDFELRQNLFRDDRRDVLSSTRAALDYLQRLSAQFNGDWQLALAAYNWGQGNVQRAIDRNRRAGLPTDYLSLQRMPLETREYLPKLQAVKNIIRKPQDYALTLPTLENHPYFMSVPIERDIDVALAARLAGMPLDEFQQLNPQLNKPVILAAGTPQVLLPYDNANRFVRDIALYKGNLASWTAWVAPKTLKPAEAARLTRMNEAELRRINAIPPRMLVKAGSTLLVPRAPESTHDVTEHIADNANLALAPDLPPLRRVTFRAGRRGDTVVAVARRYRVSAVQVAQWNRVGASARFRAGQPIVVMVATKHRHAAVAAGARHSGHRTARAGATHQHRHGAPARVRVAQAGPR